MINTILFDMGGTLEDIWYNDQTIHSVTGELRTFLNEHDLGTGCNDITFWNKLNSGIRTYKQWSESNELEKKPEEIWPEYYMADFNLDREKLQEVAERLAGMWEVTYYHRELRPKVKETGGTEKTRVSSGVISNTASLYSVFDVLEQYGIRDYFEDVTLSSVTGYRKPHPSIFQISLRQMQAKPEECAYVGDTISRDIIGAKRMHFGAAIQIQSFLSAQKDAGVDAAYQPDHIIRELPELVDYLEERKTGKPRRCNKKNVTVTISLFLTVPCHCRVRSNIQTGETKMGKITVVDIVLRLLGAVIVGFAVGAQRARTSHPAGIRTHILVALGSCVVMVTSCIMYEQTIAVFGTTPSDPARLGAQVINGIGFLGAGAILREGFTVRGLTTAASVWVVACLGLSVGMGYYVLTAVGTVIAFVTLVAFDGIQEKIRTRRRPELDLQIECDHMGDIMVELSHLAERHFAKLLNLSFGRTPHNTYIISFRASFPPHGYESAQNAFCQELAGVSGMIRMENQIDHI
ncbi:MAG: HAD-IA family hydrolase [Butyricicoccus sp.]